MNRLLSPVLFILTKTFSVYPVYAHCDVPCGIYDPKAAQLAAQTMLKMVDIIESIDQASVSLNDRNKFVRAVLTKEEHGRKCKEELMILWADYFKPEHLEKFPDLHDKFWQAMKLVSKNKQEVNRETAAALVKAVDEIAEIFHQTKATK